MTYNEFNKFCESLTATTYVNQWGESHVWKVGGKVFAIGGWEKTDEPAFTFKTTEGDFYLMQEEPGFRPAPYMASRGMKWLQVYAPSELPSDEIKDLILQSHRIVASGLTVKKQKELGLG